MTKKDRIAIVISIVAVLWIVFCFVADGAWLGIPSLLIFIGYWGYRFIKNDISFLSTTNK